MSNASSLPLLSPLAAAQMGILPIKHGAVRFAVGASNGLTSNSWKVWATKNGDVYICCRDNAKEVKVSLHASGRWRMGFTEQALKKKVSLLPGQNRAWEVWDRPSVSLPNTVIAFRLVFSTPELAVRPEQRLSRDWKGVHYIEAAPQGKLTMITLFITTGDLVLTHQSEASFCLASLDIGNNQRAQLIAHGEPEGDLPAVIESAVMKMRTKAESRGKELPAEAYSYILGRLDDGSRYLVGARARSR